MAGKMPPIGLALSGGTAKSVTHVGVIKALVEEGIPIDYVSGTSGGSIVGCFYGTGMSIPEMEDIALNLSWGKLISFRLSRLGFVSSKRIEEFIKETIGDITFADLKTPCFVVATELESGKKRVFKSGSVARAIRASCSIPQFLLPVEIDGHYYVDGGFVEYLPVETLQEVGEMFIIAVHLAHNVSLYRNPRNYLQLAMHVTGLMARTNYTHSQEKADFLIHPDLDRYGSFDFQSSAELIDLGYRLTKQMMPDIHKAWKTKSSLLRRVVNNVFSWRP